MKSEHEQRIESNARNNTNLDSPSSLRGLMKPKALRGGGGGEQLIHFSSNLQVFNDYDSIGMVFIVDHRKSNNFSSFDRVDGILEKDEEDYNDDEEDALWAQKQAAANANANSGSESLAI